MSNEKFEQINTKRKTATVSKSASHQNASQVAVFDRKTTPPSKSKTKVSSSPKSSIKRKPSSNAKKKKSSKRNSGLRRFSNFLEKNFTPLTLTVVTALILICFLLIGVICGFNLHKSLQRKRNAEDFSVYINRASKEFNVPYDIIYAVIETESSFDPNAVSPTGARGLMQINEITLTDINQNLGTSYTMQDLFDPEICIRLGSSYLARLIKRFGDYETVYAAYNAGPTIVSEWLKDTSYSKDGKTLIHDNIPYPETKRYVEKVIAFRENYLAKQS